MSLKTAVASAVVPGFGQVLNSQEGRAKVIWIGLLLSIILFPLPVFGTPTFAGIYIANVYDAYDPEHKFKFIDIRNWKKHGYDSFKERLREKNRLKQV